MYDDRIVQVLKIFCSNRIHSDLREIIALRENMPSSHSGNKYSPDEIIENLVLDRRLCRDKKENIILFDDVLTDGSHFKACQTLLKPEFPKAKIKGIFVGRTNP
jgi:predicted amidophosphoribosyltransferase